MWRHIPVIQSKHFGCRQMAQFEASLCYTPRTCLKKVGGRALLEGYKPNTRTQGRKKIPATIKVYSSHTLQILKWLPAVAVSWLELKTWMNAWDWQRQERLTESRVIEGNKVGWGIEPGMNMCGEQIGNLTVCCSPRVKTCRGYRILFSPCLPWSKIVSHSVVQADLNSQPPASVSQQLGLQALVANTGSCF